jgi:anti-sigma B factor antagonist
MPDATYTVEVIEGSPVVTAPEEMDITNADALAEILRSADCGDVVVDMSRTVFCDSVGLGVLVRGHQRAQACGGGLRLVIQAPAVLRILAVSGFDQIMPRFGTLDDALADLDRHATSHANGRD